MSAMIRMENLCKCYGEKEAVRDLTLDVPQGELFCFLGPNGAGKTTTIKMLVGLVHPSGGKAWIGGVPVFEEPERAKALIGYIPDMPYLYDRLTTSEFFDFCGDLHGVPRSVMRQREDELFALFHLADQRTTLIRDLSHGMRQRLIYAATLLHDPAVLFIDEPLIGLDPYTIRTIKDLLRQRARDGGTIFLTTHILALAEDIADRIGIIAHGELIALGSLPELLDQYNHQRLEDLFLDLVAPRPGESRTLVPAAPGEAVKRTV